MKACNNLYLSKPGVICCAGTSPQALFNAVLSGDTSGIVPITHNGKTYPEGYVSESMLPENSSNTGMDTRLLRMTCASLEQIRGEIEEAVLRFGADRIAVSVGTCDNGTEWSLPAHKEFFSTGKFPQVYDIHLQGAPLFAEFIAAKFGIKGPVWTDAAACASSASAIVKAAELIKAGICDAVITGGADIASSLAIGGFASLGALSLSHTNPFSKNRNGINLGDGAAFFVLSGSPLCATKKPATNIKILGYGESADAYHMTSPHPKGKGALQAMRDALLSAQLEARNISYINLHGTGTKQNDAMESTAIAELFSGEEQALVSSTKPITGHTLGAAGALELAICVMTLYNGHEALVPVHCWDGVYDDELPPLRFAQKGASVKGMQNIMSSSFAFGGCNTCIIIGGE
ncbi:MAG: 3-oxoacyl-ACP synthase [Spirochaetaceae bacterium]|jgi:3-oxoacyl-[acyl-carrier-protein] synthase-1|nr:3-oxoacyl-ACP synthase [Spirochaetaceae bacterium]